MHRQLSRQRQQARILIFSLLNVRKKTAATLAGIAIAALCLWGVSLWQDISLQELFSILLATLLLLTAVIAAALLLITALKLLLRAAKYIGSRNDKQGGQDPDQTDSGHR